MLMHIYISVSLCWSHVCFLYYVYHVYVLWIAVASDAQILQPGYALVMAIE